ncbi:hypothetical protein, partial [Streptomyces sp900116325]|uniref:hypothetical protein n=1 Tax=Streptomyces sp. 900116325 TaxID=3154295 RepID=UPI0034072CC9
MTQLFAHHCRVELLNVAWPNALSGSGLACTKKRKLLETPSHARSERIAMKHARPGRNPILTAAGIAIAVITGTVFTLLPRDHAHAAESQIYSGKGWSIQTSMPNDSDFIHSLSADGTGYTIAYADHHLQAGVEQAAAQLHSVTGITFATKFMATLPAQNCSTWPRHLLALGSKWQPDGVVAVSHSYPCASLGNHTAWGGWSWIDSEYWKVPNFANSDPELNMANTKNVITHEIGHLVGLDHPNKDLNGDGTVGKAECEKTVHGYLPLMCAWGGGYPDAHGGGQFTSLDVPGLKQLVANYSLPAPAGAKQV